MNQRNPVSFVYLRESTTLFRGLAVGGGADVNMLAKKPGKDVHRLIDVLARGKLALVVGDLILKSLNPMR